MYMYICIHMNIHIYYIHTSIYILIHIDMSQVEKWVQEYVKMTEGPTKLGDVMKLPGSSHPANKSLEPQVRLIQFVWCT